MLLKCKENKIREDYVNLSLMERNSYKFAKRLSSLNFILYGNVYSSLLTYILMKNTVCREKLICFVWKSIEVAKPFSWNEILSEGQVCLKSNMI